MTRLPAKTCVFCNKPLEAVGGKRIAATRITSVFLSEKKIGGGNKDFPSKSILYSSNPDVFMVVQGKKGKWTDTAIKSALHSYHNGEQPWFCQICGGRQCLLCGSPVNRPTASDVLYDDGRTSHVSIIPYDFGCSNPDCEKYKEYME